MRFTSLVVELMRARPQLMFWLLVLTQAVVWTVLPLILYGSPPGDMATVLAYGREYRMGTDLGPPLAFWLADIAFRLAGNHVFGVYLLSQLCFVVTFWALFALGRAIVGAPQAILAVLLCMTLIVFSYPGVEFGPHMLARPLWALTLLYAWRVIGEGDRKAWVPLSVAFGLLLLTTNAAIILLLLLAGFAAATPRGRQAFKSTDPLFAAVIVLALVMPYLIWLTRAGGFSSPPLLSFLPSLDQLDDRFLNWTRMLGSLLAALTGIVVLLIFNSRIFVRHPERAPIIYRPPVDPLARPFVYFFAIAPAIVLSLLAAASGATHITGGEGIVLLPVGLAVILVAGDLIALHRQRALRTAWLVVMLAPAVALIAVTFLQPWFGSEELKTASPARTIGRFFGESFQRSTNAPLSAVAGNPDIAAIVGFAAPSRPRLMFDALTPSAPDEFMRTGGVVVWRATDETGAPPDDIRSRFPSLIAQTPRVFERIVTGRLDPLRIGWGIVRPQNNPAVK